MPRWVRGRTFTHMNVDALRREVKTLVDAIDDEAVLTETVELLRKGSPEAQATAEPDGADAVVSFDADGRGYTAQQLGDTLDERVRAMRRGEGVVSLAQFEANMKAWRRNT